MRALDFSTQPFSRFEAFYQETIDHYSHVPSSTPEDFWKNTGKLIAEDKVSYANARYSLNKEKLSSFVLITGSFFLTSSVTLLNDLTGGLDKKKRKNVGGI